MNVIWVCQTDHKVVEMVNVTYDAAVATAVDNDYANYTVVCIVCRDPYSLDMIYCNHIC